MIKWILIFFLGRLLVDFTPFTLIKEPKWIRQKRLRYHSVFSTSPLSNFGCLMLIWRERYYLVPIKTTSYKKDGRIGTYQIADSDYYVVFYDSWHVELYRAESYCAMQRSYALGGISLKAQYNMPLNVVVGGFIQRWYLKNNPMVSPSE